MPWEFFLGHASHEVIAYIYGTRYPTHKVYYNSLTIKRILREQRIGDWSLLSEDERELRPDILNINTREVFEIKPMNPEGLQDGIRQLHSYLQALNRTVPPASIFSAGTSFDGEVLIQFAQGQYIWRLEWCTNTPGVTQYLWTRTQQRSESLEAAYQANQWTNLSEQELKQFGGWVARAVEGMVDRRQKLATLSGAVGVVIDVIGEAAVIMMSTTPNEQRAVRSMGKVLPFPSKVPSASTTVQLPKASGM